MLKMHNIQPSENRRSVIFISYLINGIWSVDVCCICFELTKESWIVMDFANNGPFRNEVSETDVLPFENECLDELAEVGSKEGSFLNIWYENFFHQSRSLSTKIIMYKNSRILLHAFNSKNLYALPVWHYKSHLFCPPSSTTVSFLTQKYDPLFRLEDFWIFWADWNSRALHLL